MPTAAPDREPGRDDSVPGDPANWGLVLLRVLREGTGLAGLALWGWACLRLFGG